MNWLRVGLVALAVLLVAGGVVLAAPASGEAGKAETPHPSGPPPFKGTLDVAIWTILVFLSLFFILRAYAWGPIQEALAKRERDAVAAAEAAELARQEAVLLRQQFAKEKDETSRQVAELIAEARRDAQQVAEDLKRQALAEIATERERLLREVGTARDQALQEIWQKAATLATQVSSRILPRELSDADQRRLVELALNDLQAQGDDLRTLLASRDT